MPNNGIANRNGRRDREGRGKADDEADDRQHAERAVFGGLLRIIAVKDRSGNGA